MANKSKSHKPLVLGSNRVNDTEIHYYGILQGLTFVHLPKLISQHSLPSFTISQLNLIPFTKPFSIFLTKISPDTLLLISQHDL